jgi:hypothetical protein
MVDETESRKLDHATIAFHPYMNSTLGNQKIASVTKDLTFSMNNAGPGRYWVEPYRGFPDEAYFESVRSGETDVFRDGFTIPESGTGSIEIKVVFDAGKVTGTVSDKDGQVVGGAVVALTPAERRRSDRYRDVVADQYGHFEIKGVPPGEYKVFAWEDVEPGAWFSAEFLRTCEVQGTAVTVAAKQAAAVKVGLIR